jgi:succinate dehydrogenase / fumarate reductase cytochrome b subunit
MVHEDFPLMADSRARAARPLSPHLQIYRWTWTMAMSVFHRVTGAALYLGTLLLAWWLIAAASGPQAYAGVEWFMASIIGRLILFGYTWALIHHMLGGIRHLIWDTLHGFGPQEREQLARATLYGSVILTVVLWGVGYLVMGGTR